jgi:hypothetical protein
VNGDIRVGQLIPPIGQPDKRPARSATLLARVESTHFRARPAIPQGHPFTTNRQRTSLQDEISNPTNRSFSIQYYFFNSIENGQRRSIYDTSLLSTIFKVFFYMECITIVFRSNARINLFLKRRFASNIRREYSFDVVICISQRVENKRGVLECA